MHCHSGLSRGSFLLALVLLFAAVGWSQTTTATVYGTVTDPSGAVIPGATVTMTHEATGGVATKTSGATGEFQFDFLRVGVYTLSIELQGFKRFQSSNFNLVAGQNVRQSYPLEVGDVTETVQVESAAPQVNTVSAEQLQTFESTKVRELPLARRNVTNILAIGTGVTRVTGSYSGVRMNGVGRTGASYSVDGTEATANPEGRQTSSFGGANYVDFMSIEAIQEVHTVKGVLPAEFGGAVSGQVNILTRSGTNEFHGSLFENFQSDSLNAQNPFLAEKPAFTYNQFGGAAGGAIKKDKIFLFAAYEGYREKAFREVDADVPTQAHRDLVIAAQPEYALPLEVVPLPNQPHNPDARTGEYIIARSETRRDNHVDIKGDIRLTDTKLLALTYSRGRPFRQRPRHFLNGANDQDLQIFAERGTLSYVGSGADWSSETRFGYSIADVDRFDMYFSNIDPNNSTEEFAFGRRVGRLRPNLGWSTAGAELNMIDGPTWSIGEKYAKHLGKHSIKFGGQYIRRCCQRANPENVVWSFTGLDDFLNNIPSNVNASFGNGEYEARLYEFGVFFQDDWRVRSNLTINFGLRYDFFSNMVAKEDKNSGSFFFNPDGLLDDQFNVGPIRDPSNPYDHDPINIAPRFGFSYNPDGQGKTVVRGGFGVLFAPQTLGALWQGVGTRNVPKRINFSRQESIRLGIKYPMYNDDLRKIVDQQAADEGFTNLFNIINPTLQNPYTMHITLGFQRELTSTLMIESSFVSVLGRKFMMFRWANEPDRDTGLRPNDKLRVNYYADESQTMSYTSWQTSLRKRYSRSLSGSLHYTWGKSLATNGGDPGAYYQGDSGTRTQDFFDIQANRSPSTGDQTHYVAGEWIYELPRFSNLGSSFARQVLGGWQVSGILIAHTGQPLGITQSSGIRDSRPDYVGGETVNDNYRDTRQYLNKAAFAKVPIDPESRATIRPGNLGWGAVRGPGAWTLDFSLAKNFNLTEKLKFQLRTDMFNALNHVNYSRLQASINSGSFGRVRGTTGQRVMQLNGRLSW